MVNPKTFISYSWDSEDHKEWVRMTASHLRNKGVEVFLDQWDTYPGIDLLLYMETKVRESEYVILVCTTTYAQKANKSAGGVGYERTIITGEIYHGIDNDRKFVPILRQGDPNASLPSYLKSKRYIDFRNDDKYEKALEELIRHLYRAPEYIPPPIGEKPILLPKDNIPKRTDEKILTNHYCMQCGMKPGSYSSCIGGNTHKYEAFDNDDNVFCIKCGIRPGGYSSCIGGNHHSFKGLLKNNECIFCSKCGIRPGAYSSCIGGNYHNFK